MSIGITDVGIWDGLTTPSLFGIFWSLMTLYIMWPKYLGEPGNKTRMSRE